MHEEHFTSVLTHRGRRYTVYVVRGANRRHLARVLCRGVVRQFEVCGKFRAPTLRNIAVERFTGMVEV
jgi:cytochrome c peroxidase